MKRYDWPTFLFFAGATLAFLSAVSGAWRVFAASCVVAAFGCIVHFDE
jgi:hypothetical protein